MSFLKDKLKDWCYQASIQKNMKRLRGTIKRTPLCCDNNDFPTIIGESGEPRKRKKHSNGSYSRNSRRTPFRRRSWWSKTKAEHTNLGKGVDQQGLHPKDLDEQIQDPQEEPLQEELSDRPIPGPMKVSKTATAGHVEQELIPKEEILEELSRLREEIAVTMKWIHIGTIEVVIKATFKEGIDSEIHLSIMDSRINNLRDGCLGTMIDPIRIPRIGGVDIVIKDHPVLDRTISSRTEFSSRMSFSEDRIMGYKGKEKDLLKAMTPQEIRPVVGRYEGMLEIAGHEILVAGVAGRENESMTLGLSFLEDHKPWGRKGNGRDFSQKILILNKGIREVKIMIGGAFGTPWFRDKRKFGKVLLSFRQQGLIDSDSFYEESEEEIKNLKEALQGLNTMDISEESKLSLENVKRLIQRNFSENPLAWWDRNKIEATLKIKEECKYEYVRYKPIQMNMKDKKDMQMIIKEHINLGLIEPGISVYSSPRFLVRNHGEIKRGIFIKDLAKYRKNFRPLLKETESAKWKWEEIHTQRVRELKQVCNNLPKLAIPQDEDELAVYTDANDYRWAAVLMKKTTTGEEPCRYTGGLFTEQ
ncbi:movement protein [Sesamum angolense]|uniref:Movement protein n=1 Tax=Sesamum angolense TaxID=2727404 RepID=A0AAE1WJZ5_9LAMI|nr:movement protein [Sesamum angolense]